MLIFVRIKLFLLMKNTHDISNDHLRDIVVIAVDGSDIYNADAVGAYNIMRLFRQEARYYFPIPLKGLSDPRREYIPVTDQFLNEDYINWNGKAGNVGISGRNYPGGDALIR